MVLECLRAEMRTTRKESWRQEGSVLVKRDSHLRRPVAASLVSVKLPR